MRRQAWTSVRSCGRELLFARQAWSIFFVSPNAAACRIQTRLGLRRSRTLFDAPFRLPHKPAATEDRRRNIDDHHTCAHRTRPSRDNVDSRPRRRQRRSRPRTRLRAVAQQQCARRGDWRVGRVGRQACVWCEEARRRRAEQRRQHTHRGRQPRERAGRRRQGKEGVSPRLLVRLQHGPRVHGRRACAHATHTQNAQRAWRRNPPRASPAAHSDRIH